MCVTLDPGAVEHGADLPKLVEGNFFQSSAFQKALEATGWRTVTVECQKGKYRASILAYSQETIPLYNRILAFYQVLNGPCITPFNQDTDPEILENLLHGLYAQVRRQGGTYLEVRTPFPSWFGSETYFSNGFDRTNFNGQCSVHIDLRKDVETLWKDAKHFARRNVKRAMKEGVEVRDIKTDSELRQFYMLYVETSLRRGFCALPFRLFKFFWMELEPLGLVKYFIAYWNKTPIAGILNTFYQGQAVPYVACSLDRFWNLHPNHLLFWHSIKWSKEVMHSSVFNLYHLPPKKNQTESIDYNTFKTCFGGQIVEECSCYKNIISPTRFRIFQMLKGLQRWNSSRSVSEFLIRPNSKGTESKHDCETDSL
jgi:lipid II:glycine glycyltransferase (peptidoglycan interpeptide bridge formation enzyme)